MLRRPRPDLIVTLGEQADVGRDPGGSQIANARRLVLAALDRDLEDVGREQRRAVRLSKDSDASSNVIVS